MADYTPTTEAVRNAYAIAMKNAHVTSEAMAKAEFDRWLDSIRSSSYADGARWGFNTATEQYLDDLEVTDER